VKRTDVRWLPFTVIALDVNTAVVRVASFGPYSTNVMVPVGAAADNVAESVSTVLSAAGKPWSIVGVVFPTSALSFGALHARRVPRRYCARRRCRTRQRYDFPAVTA
jgi:hypothetical protein